MFLCGQGSGNPRRMVTHPGQVRPGGPHHPRCPKQPQCWSPGRAGAWRRGQGLCSLREIQSLHSQTGKTWRGQRNEDPCISPGCPFVSCRALHWLNQKWEGRMPSVVARGGQPLRSEQPERVGKGFGVGAQIKSNQHRLPSWSPGIYSCPLFSEVTYVFLQHRGNLKSHEPLYHHRVMLIL